jgi:hypothetical protein
LSQPKKSVHSLILQCFTSQRKKERQDRAAATVVPMAAFLDSWPKVASCFKPQPNNTIPTKAVVAKKYTEATLHTSHLQKSSESNV